MVQLALSDDCIVKLSFVKQQMLLLTVKPKFKVRPVNTTVIEGQTTMIHCLATGEPTPTIQWDRNGRINDFDFSRFKVRIYPSILSSLCTFH